MNAIELKDITKHFKYFTLDKISLSLPEGYIMGLIGANGAGKTTIIKIIMGLYLYDDGDISILGMDPQREGHIMRDKIGFVFDDPKYYDFRLKKIKKIIAPFYSNWDDKIFYDNLNRFGLHDKLHFKKLSRGMKLKFALAIALSHNAKLLILDEPTSGLDPIFRLEFLSILQEIIAKKECSILFSSHITSDVEKIADYVAYIKKGKMELTGEKNDILSSFVLVRGDEDKIPLEVKDIMIAGEETTYYYEALIPASHNIKKQWKQQENPTLEKIMYYHELKGKEYA